MFDEAYAKFKSSLFYHFSKYPRFSSFLQQLIILPSSLWHYIQNIQQILVKINEKPRYPFLLISALFAENHNNLVENDGITSILFIETKLFYIKHSKISYYNHIYHQNSFG